MFKSCCDHNVDYVSLTQHEQLQVIYFEESVLCYRHDSIRLCVLYIS